MRLDIVQVTRLQCGLLSWSSGRAEMESAWDESFDVKG